MNIALGAVLIFILLIPPVVFYLSYSTGKYSKAGPKFSLLDGLLASAIVSLFIHTLALNLINHEIRFDILIKFAGGEIKDLESKISNSTFERSIKQFALYNLTILLIATILGRVTRWIVLRTNLHARNELFRLYNRWWYVFNGYKNFIEEYDVVFIDALVETKSSTVIYSGFLIDFVCNGEELDRVYLGDTLRRELRIKGANETAGTISNHPQTPVKIPGELFSLSYDKIINLNVRFFVGEAEENQESPDTVQ